MEPNENKDLIPRKLAAIEAHKRSRATYYISLIGIGASVIPIFFYTADQWAGSIAACIFAGFLGFNAVRVIKDVKSLEATYKLK